MTQFQWLYCCNQIALREWNWLRKYLTALANFTVVKKWYPCNDCYVTCMFCNMNRFGGTLSPLHQILTPVHDKTEVGMLLYVLTQLWGQINPSGFQSPLLVKYDIVFMWIKYFEFEFEFDNITQFAHEWLSWNKLSSIFEYDKHGLLYQNTVTLAYLAFHCIILIFSCWYHHIPDKAENIWSKIKQYQSCRYSGSFHQQCISRLGTGCVTLVHPCGPQKDFTNMN